MKAKLDAVRFSLKHVVFRVVELIGVQHRRTVRATNMYQRYAVRLTQNDDDYVMQTRRVSNGVYCKYASIPTGVDVNVN